ncbi:hypothetical protein LXL04_028260 [Taraxacum kok-saghyz]
MSKRKKTTEDDLDRVSVHTCLSGGLDEEVEAIKIPEKRPIKQLANKPSLKKPKAQAKTKEAIEAKKYHEAFEELDFRSPFTDEINETPVPKGLKGPRIRMYDGTGDPDDHSLYFAGTLDGSARYWLASLLPKSIGSFEELRRKFCNSFIQQRRYQQQAHAIFACRQREGESNKLYFKRYPHNVALTTYFRSKNNKYENRLKKTLPDLQRQTTEWSTGWKKSIETDDR